MRTKDGDNKHKRLLREERKIYHQIQKVKVKEILKKMDNEKVINLDTILIEI